MGKLLHVNLARLVRDLVEAHRRLQPEDELLLAIWYHRASETDIHLIEVYRRYPDSGTGDLSTYQFGPGVTFPLPGKLYLTSCGPEDFKVACRLGHRLISKARRDGRIVFAASLPKTTVQSLRRAFNVGGSDR